MITEIVKLFTNFIREKVELDRHYDYENIHLCYLSKLEWFKKSGWYWAKRLFGIPFQQFGYKCCMVREDTVCCDDKLHRVEGYRLFPYIISICLLSYSPILLLRFAIFAKKDDDDKSQKECSKPSKKVSIFLRFPFFLRFCDYKYHYNNNKKTHKESKLDNSTTQAPGDIQSSLEEGHNQNIPAGHIQNIPEEEDSNRTLEPGSNQSISESVHIADSQTNPLIDKDDAKNVAWFFMSVYNKFLERLKRLTFLLFFPSMIYFEFILLMSDVEWKELLQTIGKDNLLFGFPTMLGSVNNITFLPPEGPMGALIIYYVFGFLIIVCPSDFENSVLGQGIAKFEKNTVDIKSSYNKIKKILLKYMFFPLDVGYWTRGNSRTLFEQVRRFCPLFLFPIIPFSLIAFGGWIRYLLYKKLKDCCCCLKYSILFILVLVFLTFYGIFVVMLSYSIYLLFYILFFTSLGFIMSPNNKSKTLIFIVGTLAFEYQIIRDSVHLYTELFHLIVEICECDNSLKEKCITDHENEKCIKEYLVVEVFRKIRPAFVQLGHIIIKTVIVVLIYVSALLFMLKFNDKISDIIERVSILITSVTPIILQWRFKTVCPKRQRVELIIRKCVKEAEQKAKEAKLDAEKIEQNAQEGNDEKSHKEAERKAKEAERKAEEAETSAKEAELNAKEAECNTNEAIEAERNVKETERNAKEAERNTNEAIEAERNVKETERNAKEAERTAKDAARKAREDERNAKEAELKSKEAELKTKEAELKTKEVKIKIKEAELKTRESKIKTKEAELNTKERKLKTKILKFGDVERKTSKADQNAEKAERNALKAEQTDTFYQSM